MPVDRQRRALLPAAACVLFVLIAGIRLSVPIVRSDDVSTPVSALGHLPPSLDYAPVLNDYAFGGYLIFAGIKPFIDSRAELYGDSFLQDYARIIRPDSAALAETLAVQNIVWTVFAPGNPAAGELDRLGWRRLYADRWAVVHVRAGLPSPMSSGTASLPSPVEHPMVNTSAVYGLNPVLTARKP
jgi:hypothetical protein